MAFVNILSLLFVVFLGEVLSIGLQQNSNEEPTCNKIEHFFGGKVEYLGGRKSGTYAVFSCNEHHNFYPKVDKERVKGKRITTCQYNLTWESIPKCVAGCLPPSELSNVEDMYLDGSGIDIQDYHCQRDSVPFPKQRITCRNGTWSADAKCLSTTVYEIKIQTSSKYFAGTNGDVYINIKGDLFGDTGLQYLDLPGDTFERSSLDTIEKRLVDVGKIRMIQLGVKWKAPSDGWTPSNVKIYVPSRNELYLFEHDESGIDDTSVMLQPIVLCKPSGTLSEQSRKEYYRPGERFICRPKYILLGDGVCENGAWTSEPHCVPDIQYRIRFEAPFSAPRLDDRLFVNIIGINGQHTGSQLLYVDCTRRINQAYIYLQNVGQIGRIEVSGVKWVPVFVSITVPSKDEFYVFYKRPMDNKIEFSLTLYPEGGKCKYTSHKGYPDGDHWTTMKSARSIHDCKVLCSEAGREKCKIIYYNEQHCNMLTENANNHQGVTSTYYYLTCN